MGQDGVEVSFGQLLGKPVWKATFILNDDMVLAVQDPEKEGTGENKRQG